MWAIGVLYFLFALVFIVAKSALCYASPIFFVGLRMVVGGALLIGTQWLRGQSVRIAARDLIPFAGLALIHIYIPYVTEFVALADVSAAKAAIFYNLSPFLTALSLWFLHGDRLNHRQIIGMLIGFIGFMPLIWQHLPTEHEVIFMLSGAELLLFASVIASVFGWIALKALVKRGYSPILVNGVAMLVGGLGALVTAAGVEHVYVNNWQLLGVWTVASILLGNVICYNLYGFLLAHHSPTLLSFAGFLCPLFTALLQWALFGELVTWHFWVTLSTVILGLYLFSAPKKSIDTI